MLTWLEISKANLLHNSKQLRKLIGKKTKLLAVVKSNSYGHGMVEVAGILSKKVDWFGVAGLSEALELRFNKITKPILVLSFFETDKKDLSQAILKKITLPGYSLKQLKKLDEVAKKSGLKARIHIKVDTGTSRVGIRPEKLEEYCHRVSLYKNLNITGVYSHFADSEENLAYTNQQIGTFEKSKKIVLKYFPNAVSHMACSAASVLHTKSHYDLIRAGIMIYGLYPSKKTRQAPTGNDYVGRNLNLKPVLTWKTKIVQIKELPKGTFVGYGLSFRTKKKTTMAVLPVGYADGYPRRLSNRGEVLVRGKRVKIMGRVCMNLLMIDITGIAVQEGDEVVLLGSQGRERVSAEELASHIGTINYEVVTRINWRLPRVLVK